MPPAVEDVLQLSPPQHRILAHMEVQHCGCIPTFIGPQHQREALRRTDSCSALAKSVTNRTQCRTTVSLYKKLYNLVSQTLVKNSGVTIVGVIRAATNGITLFFLPKNDDLFLVAAGE